MKNKKEESPMTKENPMIACMMLFAGALLLVCAIVLRSPDLPQTKNLGLDWHGSEFERVACLCYPLSF